MMSVEQPVECEFSKETEVLGEKRNFAYHKSHMT
jgi:hypothetical protein